MELKSLEGRKNVSCRHLTSPQKSTFRGWCKKYFFYGQISTAANRFSNLGKTGLTQSHTTQSHTTHNHSRTHTLGKAREVFFSFAFVCDIILALDLYWMNYNQVLVHTHAQHNARTRNDKGVRIAPSQARMMLKKLGKTKPRNCKLPSGSFYCKSRNVLFDEPSLSLKIY